MKTTVIILVLLFLTNLAYSNDKGNKYLNGVSTSSTTELTLFSFRIGKTPLSSSPNIMIPNEVGLYGIGSFIALQIIVMVIGGLGILAGSPILGVGVYQYSQAQSEDNRNLLISGATILGTGILTFLPLLILYLYGRLRS